MTENDVKELIRIEAVAVETRRLRAHFAEEDARYLDISDTDFLSLVLMTPSVAIALANGSISLREEFYLNKYARRLSVGKYFLGYDPVIHAMRYLIGDFERWADVFYAHIRFVVHHKLDAIRAEALTDESAVSDRSNFLINFLETFFNRDERHLFRMRTILREERDAVRSILTKLDLMQFEIVRQMVDNLNVRSSP